MQLMCEHLSMLANFNERHDKLFNEAEELKSQMLHFKVSWLLIVTLPWYYGFHFLIFMNLSRYD